MPAPLLPFVTLTREVLADCRVFKVERVKRRSERSGIAHDFFHIDCAEWVNVVALTAAGEIVLVRQERHGVEAFTLELPAGMVDRDEAPADAAARELLEESGFRAASIAPLGWVHPNPALQDNRCHTFLARDCVRVAEQKLDGREEIEVVLVPFEAMRSLVKSGQIKHALVVAALYLFELGDG